MAERSLGRKPPSHILQSLEGGCCPWAAGSRGPPQRDIYPTISAGSISAKVITLCGSHGIAALV